VGALLGQLTRPRRSSHLIGAGIRPLLGLASGLLDLALAGGTAWGLLALPLWLTLL
jgi:hypothetical protein